MRSVLFIRHANSSWGNKIISDYERPLNDRGKKEAPEMARRLLSKNIPLDFFISSSAKRARQTAEFFTKAYCLSPGSVLMKEELYLPSPEIFYDIIDGTANEFQHLAICSHNPAITQFLNQITDKIRVDEMPPCGILGIRTDAFQWNDFRKSQKIFWFFDYPQTFL